MKGYKVFDKNWCCRGFQYEIGKEYVHKAEIDVCCAGFHFCEKLIGCYEYYEFNDTNKIAEVEAIGNIKTKNNKSVTDKLKIIKEISWNDCLEIVNTGDRNTGHRNTGDSNTGHSNTGDSNTGDWNTGFRNTGYRNTGFRNTGYRNTGFRNTGDRNTGHRNTGDSNTGHRNTGHSNTGDSNTGDWNTGFSNTGYRNTGFRNTGDRNTGHRNTGDWNTGDWNKCNCSPGVLCTQEQNILIFDNPSNFKLDEWRNSKYSKLFSGYNVNVWIDENDMSDREKNTNPTFYVQGGYLKIITPEEAWENWFSQLTKKQIKLLKEIPNWDTEKFKYITGLNVQ